jgi:hypothetical protein
LQTDGTTRISVAAYGLVDIRNQFVVSAGVAQLSSTTTLGFTSGVPSLSMDTRLSRVSAGVLGIRGSGGTVGATIELFEQTAPVAGAADTVRIYAEDDGAGKTRLMALFPTGAAQQIAIEP